MYWFLHQYIIKNTLVHAVHASWCMAEDFQKGKHIWIGKYLVMAIEAEHWPVKQMKLRCSSQERCLHVEGSTLDTPPQGLDWGKLKSHCVKSIESPDIQNHDSTKIDLQTLKELPAWKLMWPNMHFMCLCISVVFLKVIGLMNRWSWGQIVCLIDNEAWQVPAQAHPEVAG